MGAPRCRMRRVRGMEMATRGGACRDARACVALLTGLITLGGNLHETAGAKAQDGAGRVAFATFINGQEVAEEGRIFLECAGAVARIRTEELGEPLPQAPAETRTIDFEARVVYQTADFRDGSRCTVETGFGAMPAWEATGDAAEIFGYSCRRARAVVRSNQIDFWYTLDAGLQGSPSGQFVVPGALVLKIVRNGNYEIVAREIDLEWKPQEPLLPLDWGEGVDAAEYRRRTAEAFVTTIGIFDREPIRFLAGSGEGDGGVVSGADSIARISAADRLEDPPEETQTVRFANGTVILRRVALPSVSDDYAVFAELVHRSKGDAYDRTGSIFIIPTDRRRSFLDGLREGVDALPVVTDSHGRAYQGIVAAPDYLPPIELIRFITPFGVGHFNKDVSVRGLAWADSAVYKQDLTELLPVLRGSVWIGAFIGNYDAGGHEVSLRLRYYPGERRLSGAAPRRRWSLPLFDTVNRMEMAGQEYGRIFERDTLSVDFEVPEGVSRCVLRFISTGHGGWGGGDEFNLRMNRILLDGRVVGAFTPWRSDCANYRALNPASGNFWNGLSSSDFSRSGWCPGAAVSPSFIQLEGLEPGRHLIQVVIPAGPPEGTSFSAWSVSGVLLGEH